MGDPFIYEKINKERDSLETNADNLKRLEELDQLRRDQIVNLSKKGLTATIAALDIPGTGLGGPIPGTVRPRP